MLLNVTRGQVSARFPSEGNMGVLTFVDIYSVHFSHQISTRETWIFRFDVKTLFSIVCIYFNIFNFHE